MSGSTPITGRHHNMGQNMLLPTGHRASPYLSGNPALKNAGTGQQRLNTSTAIQNYNAATHRPAAAGAWHSVSVQLHLVEVPDQQPEYYGDGNAKQARPRPTPSSHIFTTWRSTGLCDTDAGRIWLPYDLPFGPAGRSARLRESGERDPGRLATTPS
jgi:hypothetical protein